MAKPVRMRSPERPFLLTLTLRVVMKVLQFLDPSAKTPENSQPNIAAEQELKERIHPNTAWYEDQSVRKLCDT